MKNKWFARIMALFISASMAFGTVLSVQAAESVLDGSLLDVIMDESSIAGDDTGELFNEEALGEFITDDVLPDGSQDAEAVNEEPIVIDINEDTDPEDDTVLSGDEDIDDIISLDEIEEDIIESEIDDIQAPFEDLSEQNEEVLDAAITVSISKTEYAYTGKAIKPTVKIKDQKGKTVAKSNYTVTYPSGCKNVGKYTISVKLKGKYSGTKKLSFTIVPKGTSISGLTGSDNKITATIKKQTAQTTGYQVSYSTDPAFETNSKTLTISKNTTTKTTLKNLLYYTKYYVRVRTYKTVSGKKYYSSWSLAKSTTTGGSVKEPTDPATGVSVSSVQYNIPDNSPVYYYRSLLSGTDLEIYDAWVEAYRNPGKQVAVSTTANAHTIGELCAGDHPEFLRSSFNYGGYGNVSYVSVEGIEEDMTYDTPAKVMATVDNKMKSFYSRLLSEKSDYDRIKLIYDYLVESVTYQMTGNHQSITGSLLAQRSVCAGYARAFQYLCHKMGIPCVFVPGTVDGMGHARNAVKLGGDWYMVDATFGDGFREREGCINYMYLLAGDYDFDIDAQIRPYVPKLGGTKFLKYEFQKHLLISATPDAIAAELMRQYQAGEINVLFQFKNVNDYNTGYAYLIGNHTSITGYYGRSYSFLDAEDNPDGDYCIQIIYPYNENSGTTSRISADPVNAAPDQYTTEPQIIEPVYNVG